jgi:hypothetical protein
VFAGIGGESRGASITLVTDAFVVRGTFQTRHRRITDMLNSAENDFLVLEDATFDEFGSAGSVMQTDFAQVNLGAVLFGVADEPVDPTPELRIPKVSQRALITVPPFTVTGHIHVMPERDLRQALDELVGRFIPVTDAVYWADRIGEGRKEALVVAINHHRAQILAPFREVDPWAGLDRSGQGAAPGPGASPHDAASPEAPRPPDPAWPEVDRPG